jgi:protein-S-isoprenylcysteine O-methyltransferase Ste14
VLFPVALVLGLGAPLLALTGTTPPVAVLPVAVLLAVVLAVAGFVVGVAGIGLVLAAQAAMGTSWRIGVDEDERIELVTGGLFGRVRNPIFTGMVAVSVGVLLMVPTAVAAVATACLVAAVQIQVRVVEEPYLRRTHGRADEIYLAGSGRFLARPSRIGRTRPPGRPRRGEAGPEDAITRSRRPWSAGGTRRLWPSRTGTGSRWEPCRRSGRPSPRGKGHRAVACADHVAGRGAW